MKDPQQRAAPTASDAPPLVLAITGASGVLYAVELLRRLLAGGHRVHLTISPSGAAVIKQELEIDVALERWDAGPLLEYRPAWRSAASARQRTAAADTAALQYHHYQDYLTPIASGSYLTAGMIICPCSGSTLAGIAHASSSNLIQRAAEVHLKERRKLVVVPRETPLSTFALENMHRLSLAGAVVLPAMPGWYHGVRSPDDLIDFVVARILDQLALPNRLIARWGEPSDQAESADQAEVDRERGPAAEQEEG